MSILQIVLMLFTVAMCVFIGCGDFNSSEKPLLPRLWTADVSSQKLYCLDLAGQTVGSIDSPCINPSGVCFDGTSLWVSDANAGKLWKIDWNDGRIISSLPAPGPVPGDLAYDGDFIWVADTGNNRVCQIEASTGYILYSFNSPVSGPVGLAYDGSYIWVSCLDNYVIQVAPVEGGIVIAYGQLPFARCTGLAYAHGTLWALDVEGNNIYEFDPNDLSVKNIYHLEDQSYPNALDFADPAYGPGYNN